MYMYMCTIVITCCMHVYNVRNCINSHEVYVPQLKDRQLHYTRMKIR